MMIFSKGYEYFADARNNFQYFLRVIGDSLDSKKFAA